MRLFDTSFIIDLVNGERGATSKAAQVDEERTFKTISTITVQEYLRGIYYLYSEEEELLKSKLEKAEGELARFEILPYIYEVAKLAAELDAELTKQGEPLSFADVIIASTALHHNLTLVTRNDKHFQRIPKLRLETY